MDDFFTQLSSQERVEALMRKRPLMILCDRLIPFGAIAILSISTALAEQAGRVSDRPSANAGLDSSFRKAGAAELAGPLKAAFEANVGQTDPQVRFLSRGRGAQLFLTSEEAVLKFGPSRDAVLRMRLLGANVHAQLEGMEPLLGHSNYFTGSDPRNWHTSVSQFAKVLYRDVYPGIDLAYHSTGRDFEYDFILEPGRSPQAITVDFVGAADLRMDAGGNLVLSTAAGDVYHKKPVAYQLKQDRRIFVEAAYVLKGRRSAGFRLGHYDPSLPLVIDPVLSFSGYQGGTGLDQAYGIAVDAAGNSYITGTTESINFPLQSQFAPYPNDNRKNAFVMKLNPQGTTVLYSTYLGGNADDEGLAIAVDSSGQALVAGYTDSTNFPTASPYRATNSGGRDGFVARLNATGNALVYSTYLGGSGSDLAFAIALDGQSNVYVAGSTASTSFPTVNPYQATLGALRDAFVTKFNPAGSTLLYSTYLGGNADDVGYGIAVDASGSAFVTGITQSDNFPTANAMQATYEGGTDVFVTKLNAAGSELAYSTYLGAGFAENCYSIAVDRAGSAYVAGSTESATFPVTSPYQGSKRGGIDAFVTKLTPSGKARVYSTFLGGNAEDRVNAIAVDSMGNATVTGFTLSSDFPTLEPLQSAYGGGQDAFVTRLNASGVGLLYSTYFGGSGEDEGKAIALDAAGSAYIAGLTLSTNFTVSTGSSPYRGAGDAFVAKITDDSALALFVPVIISSAGIGGSFYTSELTLTNRSVQTATLEFTYVQAFGGGGGTASTTLPAGQQRIVPDAIGYLISLGMPIPASGNRGGTLRVRFTGLSSPGDGAVTVRTATAVAAGRAGLAYPGVSTMLALTGTSFVPGLRQNVTDRSNLALQHAGTAAQGSITLRLTVFSGNPGSPSQTTLPDQTLGSGEFYQLTLILQSNGLNLNNAFVKIERISGTAPYYAYGVINDNANSDGSFIPAIPENALTGRSGLTLPVIVEGAFTSELVLTNWSTQQKVLRFTYVESAQASAATASFSINLNPSQQTIIPNLLEYLRSLNTPGIGPFGLTYVGALFATVDGGDGGGIFVGARTATPGGGGAFGLFYPAVPYATASTGSAWLFGLQQNTENRTNLALVNTGEEGNTANTFSIDLYDGNTGAKVTTLTETLNARAWKQIGTILTNAPGVTQGYARVTRTSGSNPFITYAVVNDGGQPNQRSGDGAFVASAP
ncbi:MAG: SBBP repeat-containing protein [Acidobacteria bacterium]|nr:SBBP repeat-containing protein [Acidobacteriota bacterium]